MLDLEFQAVDCEEVALGDVCVFRGGSGFKEEYQGQTHGEFPFIKVSDLTLPENGKYIVTSNNWVSDTVLQKLKANLQPEGSTVFAKVGAALKLNRRRILTRPTAIDNNMMAAIPIENRLDSEFLYYFLLVQDLGHFSQESAVPSVNQGHLSSIDIGLPPLPEQRKIAEILRTWDAALEQLTALRAAKETRLTGLRDGLLFGSLRLGKQKSNWQSRRIGEVTHEITDRNGDMSLGRDLVMGVTNARGIVPMREQTVAADISRYKHLPPHAFAYNPMRINVGSIAMNEADETVLVSPDYVVFGCNHDGMEPDYLDHLRRTRWWLHHINSGGSGSVRQRTYYADLAALQLPLPSLEEQRAIIVVLHAAKADLSATDQMINALTQQKRGLMQKLLTGEWPVSVDGERGGEA
jgi:type I restriction enzyme S subunit